MSAPGRRAERPPAGAQRRVVRTLAASQVFSGVGNGAALTVGSVLAAELSGQAALGGTASMAMNLGGALAAIPLARVGLVHGRRTALTAAYLVAALGALCMMLAPVVGGLPLLLLGSAGIGLGAAGNLQARFAATDLAEPGTGGRDLGTVVWSITVGAVAGPNLVGPGAVVGRALGLPGPSGVFVFSLAGMLLAVAVLQVGLRPDPLVLRRSLDGAGTTPPSRPGVRAGLRVVAESPAVRVGVAAIVAAHALMVSVMAMTPVHLSAGGGPDVLVAVGAVISGHIAGMYALSPVMGWIADRRGPLTVVAAGWVLFLVSAAAGALGAGHTGTVALALVLLGLAWSAVTVAGSTWVSSVASGPERVAVQGLTDAGMGAAAACAAGLAGVVLGLGGFGGLNLLAGGTAALMLAWVLVARRRHAGERPPRQVQHKH